MASEDILEQYLRPRPEVKLDDVIGLEAAKQTLMECVILPIKFPQNFSGRRPPPVGHLLYGAPGTGKTLLGKALASQVPYATFLNISASDFMSKYISDDGEKVMKALFEKARMEKPSIILIDDIELIGSCSAQTYLNAQQRTKVEFLVQMSACCNSSDTTGISVIGTTNLPHEIEYDMRRHFENRIHVSLPDLGARSQMFKHQLGQSAHSLTEGDFRDLGQRSEGYTGSDIMCVIKDAEMQPVRVIGSATHFKKVTGPSAKDPSVIMDDLLTPCCPEDPGAIEMDWTQVTEDKLLLQKIDMETLLKAVSKSKPSVTEKDLEKIQEFTRDFAQEV